MKCLRITSPDINNGLGIRATVWFAGCAHHCKGCHNQWTWDYNQGEEWKIGSDKWNELLKIMEKPYMKGITLSGGDPLTQSNDDLDILYESLVKFKELYPDKDIWMYTGYYVKDIIGDKHKKQIIDLCDYIVDGPFEIENYDMTLAFKGSSNQHLLRKGKDF